MKFRNGTGNEIQIMFNDKAVPRWKGLKPGNEIDLVEEYGRNLGLMAIEEPEIPDLGPEPESPEEAKENPTSVKRERRKRGG